jgi:16S rRNA G527 N7-methylase RsmG
MMCCAARQRAPQLERVGRRDHRQRRFKAYVCGSHAREKDFVYGLSEEQQRQLDMYIDFLLTENTKFNMTAVRNKIDAYTRHVQDSLALLQALEGVDVTSSAREKVMDVGSGPGLPGIILAIARPDWQVRLQTSD